MLNSLLYSSLAGLAASHAVTAGTHRFEDACPILGQVYPVPTAIASSPIWQEAKAKINHAIDTWAILEKDTSTYAMQIVSLHEPLPIYERYHKAPNHLHGGSNTTNVDGDTIFRVGSLSKLITVHGVLAKCRFKCWEDPITKYIPELANLDVNDRVLDTEWEDITISSLVSQMSGLSRDVGSGDAIVDPAVIPGSQFGLPTVDEMESEDVPLCNASPEQPPCSRADYIKMVKKLAPGFAPWYSPLYSNEAFQLLGYVLEGLTGQSYSDAIESQMSKPLGMTGTKTYNSPDDKHSILVPGESWYGWRMGDGAAAAGMYSSTNDLATHALSILNHTQFTRAQTRRWLKPVSHTSNIRAAVGAPWEIERHEGESRYHNIDIYTKVGGLQDYATYYAIIPEYDIAIVAPALSNELGLFATELVKLAYPHLKKALIEIAKTQAIKNFAGTYVDPTPGSNSYMTITADDDAGLLVSEWVNKGADIESLRKALKVTNEGIRLYPSELSSTKGPVTKVAFRANMLDVKDACVSWQKIGKFLWGSKGLDAVTFETDEETGEAHSVILPAFRAKFRKVKRGLTTQGEL